MFRPTKPANELRVERVLGDRGRPNANARGYTYRWRKARLGHLARYPLCEDCLAKGVIAAGSDVDHIVPHRGDQKLFWDRGNWQTLCEPCHKSKTGRGE